MIQTELKNLLMKDTIYLSFLHNKKTLLQPQYKGLYNKVGYTFRGKLYKSNKLKNLFMSEIFNSTDNKTFTEFMEALGEHTELYNEYENIVNAVSNIHNDVESTLIADICLLVFTLDTYIGFMIEYIIAESLRNEGFTVVSNTYLDTNYKVDLLVGHPQSFTAVAIQCKSYTNKNIKKYTKLRTIEGLKQFKKDYSQFEDLNCINDMKLRYIYYDSLEGITEAKNNIFRTVEGKSLVDVKAVEHNYFSWDKDLIQSNLQQKEIFNIVPLEYLILELKELLGIAKKPNISHLNHLELLEMDNKDLLSMI